MIRITHASLLAAAIGAALTLPFAERAAAQEVGGRGTADITSPEVTSDRRVTFRLRAPEAKAVTISGDFGSDAVMRKGDGGVWSVTVGPHPDDRQGGWQSLRQVTRLRRALSVLFRRHLHQLVVRPWARSRPGQLAHGGDSRGIHGRSGLTPFAAHVGEDAGDLVVRQRRSHRRH
jgi:hypothetical protein